jgi:hypothetical protein
MQKTEVQKELEKFRDYVISQSRRNLSRLKKNSSKRLYQSIQGDVKAMPNSMSIQFTMEDYGIFQDAGVSGKKKKYNTPYSYKSKMPPTPTNQYVNFLYRKYRRIGNAFAQTGSDVSGLGFEGFGYYAEGSNPVLFDVFSDQTEYYYNPINNVGWFTAYTGGSVAKVKYTNYSTAASQTITLTTNTVRDVTRVYSGWEAQGNRVDFLDASNISLWTANVYPKTECKYTPVQIDFVNKYGAWQREWFFKASYDSLNVQNTEYNLMQSTFPNYLLTEGQREVFNANGKQTIKVNSDWVDESFKDKIKQLMLSEKILVNETAAKLNTKSMDLKKSINSKLINYEMEFEFAYDVINSVI